MTEFLSRPETYTITGGFVVLTICLVVITASVFMITTCLHHLYRKYTWFITYILINKNRYTYLSRLDKDGKEQVENLYNQLLKEKKEGKK